MNERPQLRLFDDQPVTAGMLSVSGSIAHVEDKPPDPLGVMTSGVALVEYTVARTTFAPGKLGVGLTQGEQVVVRRFYPLADQEQARVYVDALRADVRRELEHRRAAAMGRANGSAECESGSMGDVPMADLRLAR